MRAPLVLAAASLLAASACKKEKTAMPTPEPPPPPASLTVDAAPADPEQVSLAWSAPDNPDAWWLEASIEGGPWLVVAESFPPSARSAVLTLDPQTPDGVRAFRLRAVSRGLPSAPSPEASYLRPVRAATGLVAWRGLDGLHHVAWQPQSPNGVPLVERRFVRGDGVAGAWSALPGLAFDGTYSDSDGAGWNDGGHFEYRVSYSVGAATSDSIATAGPVAPPLPLASLSATVVGSVVHVAWAYPGVAPVDVAVQRGQGVAFLASVGTVTSPASSLDDPLPAAGVWIYTAQARLHGASPYDASAASALVEANVLVPDPSWAGVVDATLRMMPPATCAARDSAGRFVLVDSAPASGFTLYTEDATGFGSWSGPAGSASIAPCALVDPADGLHVLYQTYWAGAAPIVHRWRDATGWHEENVTTAGGYNAAPIASLDAAGNPALVWNDGTARWAHVATGAWVAETLPAPYDTISPTSPLAFAPGSADPAVIAYGPSLVLRTGATWSASQVPGALAASAHQLWRPSASQAIVGYWTFGAMGEDYWVTSWTLGGWSAAEKALSSVAMPSVAAASKLDGSRIVVAQNGGPATLAVRDAGVWHTIALANDATTPAVGFGADGRWWALFGLGHSTASPQVAYVLYQEH